MTGAIQMIIKTKLLFRNLIKLILRNAKLTVDDTLIVWDDGCGNLQSCPQRCMQLQMHVKHRII